MMVRLLLALLTSFGAAFAILHRHEGALPSPAPAEAFTSRGSGPASSLFGAWASFGAEEVLLEEVLWGITTDRRIVAAGMEALTEDGREISVHNLEGVVVITDDPEDLVGATLVDESSGLRIVVHEIAFTVNSADRLIFSRLIGTREDGLEITVNAESGMAGGGTCTTVVGWLCGPGSCSFPFVCPVSSPLGSPNPCACSNPAKLCSAALTAKCRGGCPKGEICLGTPGSCACTPP